MSAAEKLKQTKLKGKDLRRKVCAATEKRVFVIPTAAELAAMREMRERLTALARRQHGVNSPAELMRGAHAVVDVIMVDEIGFHPALKMWGMKPMNTILVDEIDFEVAAARRNVSRGIEVEVKEARAAGPVKAAPSSLAEGWGGRVVARQCAARGKGG